MSDLDRSIETNAATGLAGVVTASTFFFPLTLAILASDLIWPELLWRPSIVQECRQKCINCGECLTNKFPSGSMPEMWYSSHPYTKDPQTSSKKLLPVTYRSSL